MVRIKTGLFPRFEEGKCPIQCFLFGLSVVRFADFCGEGKPFIYVR